jgi:hypothetical protein
MIGSITNNTFEVRARSSNGKPLYVILNDVEVAEIFPENDSSLPNYLHIRTIDYSSSNIKDVNIVEFKYNGVLVPELTKSFTMNQSPIFSMTLSTRNRNKAKYAYERMVAKNPDLVMFLGEITTDYSSDISSSDLAASYFDSKYNALFII